MRLKLCKAGFVCEVKFNTQFFQYIATWITFQDQSIWLLPFIERKGLNLQAQQ